MSLFNCSERKYVRMCRRCCHYCLSFCKTIITQRCQLLHQTYSFHSLCSYRLFIIYATTDTCLLLFNQLSLFFIFKVQINQLTRKINIYRYIYISRIEKCLTIARHLSKRKQNILHKILRSNSEGRLQNGENKKILYSIYVVDALK